MKLNEAFTRAFSSEWGVKQSLLPGVPWDKYVDAESLSVAALTGLDATVQQVGATMPPPNVVEEALIQIDVRAPSKKEARNRAVEARSRLLALPTLSAAGKVSVVQGPSWLPEPDGEPRYVFTVTITSRAQHTQ